jgi:hypothetical protein
MPHPHHLTITKTSLHAPNTDTTYWRTQSAIDRLTALEEIRQEYHQWKYGGQLEFQRICAIQKNGSKNHHQNQTMIANLDIH